MARIIFADVDTELTCDTRQPGALHNMEIFYKIIQKYFQQFPSYLRVPGPVSPCWVGDRMCLEINPEETNGDLNMSYVKIAIVMSQYYITWLGSHNVRY